MSQTYYKHPVLGDVTLSQSRRSTRIALSVNRIGHVRLSFPYGVSARRALAFLEEKIDWITAMRQRQAERHPSQPQLPPEQEQARVEELRRQAKADLPARVARISEVLGLTYNKVSIRAARSKWGSCSGRNNLSLSLFLMTLPEHLRDYVIVHELCHTVHKNHSPRFHALVDASLGGKEKALNKELRTYAILG
ncbi:MAG: SprT family zinc-dependent metalloprotease [Alistipes sp.]